MGRGKHGLCLRCGTTKRGRSARISEAVTICALCHAPICMRHAITVGSEQWCSRCHRERRLERPLNTERMIVMSAAMTSVKRAPHQHRVPPISNQAFLHQTQPHTLRINE